MAESIGRDQITDSPLSTKECQEILHLLHKINIFSPVLRLLFGSGSLGILHWQQQMTSSWLASHEKTQLITQGTRSLSNHSLPYCVKTSRCILSASLVGKEAGSQNAHQGGCRASCSWTWMDSGLPRKNTQIDPSTIRLLSMCYNGYCRCLQATYSTVITWLSGPGSLRIWSPTNRRKKKHTEENSISKQGNKHTLPPLPLP